jgi:hypothetical protein
MGFRWDSGDRSLVKEDQEQQKKPFVGVCCGRKKSVIRLQKDEQQEGKLVAMHQ